MNRFRSAPKFFIFLAAVWLFCIPAKSEAAENEYDPVLFPENYQPGFLGKELIPKNSQNSGAASNNIPILVPPGRGRIQLNDLALNYNSGSKNGFVGVGWSLELGAIQRATKRGVNYSANEFIAFKNGSKELVARPEWGSGYYGAKIEEDFTKYHFSATNGWTAYSKDGTRYYYGRTSASRQQNTKGIFKWCLDKVVDSNGNTMTLTYIKDQGQIYPNSVSYSVNSVTFEYENRTDFSPDYASNSLVVTAKRLKRIKVYANGALARSYTLDYEYGESTGFSRLTRVNQPLLPPITIGWNEGGSGDFSDTSIETIATQGSSYPGYVNLVDVSGDGRADLIKRSSYGSFWIYLSSGDGNFANPVETITTQGSSNIGYVNFADLNNDGRMDLIKHSAYGYFYAYLSTGNGNFASPIETHTIQGSSNVGHLAFADFNGDGFSDLIKRSAYGYFYVYLSTGDGRFAEPIETRTTQGSSDNGYVHFADINGDGRTDLIKHSAYGYFYVYFSTGDGRFADPVETFTTKGSSNKGFINFADINGDGLTDLITHSAYGYFYVHFSAGDGSFLAPVETRITQGSTDSGYVHFAEVNSDGFGDLVLRTAYGRVYTYLSNGDGTFDNPVELIVLQGAADPGYVHFADIRGKRVSDLVTHSTYGRFYARLCNGGPTDLMTSITNGRGATSLVTYRLSNDYPDSTLSFVVNTVATLTVDDGNGNQSTFSYDYSGGRFDAVDREFRGFHYNIQTNPDQTTVHRWFHQDDFYKGKDDQIKFKSPSATLSLIDSTWDKVNFSQGAFVKLAHKHKEIYDGATIRVDQSYTYNNSNGNLLSSVSSGPEAEDLTISQQYGNYGTWNWRRTQLLVSGGQSGTVRKINYEYESGTGNLLSKQLWNDRGENPIMRWTYDSYGNPVTETDARGNTTVTEYETIAHTYPSTIQYPETNGVSHVEENLAFNYRVGQVTTVRDENNNLTYYAYDSLGRLTRADFPDGGQAVHTYWDSSFPTYVKTTIKTGSGTPITSYKYFDGLQRKIQTLTYGENGKPIYTHSFYDNMGRNYRNEGPYFAKSGGYPWEKSTFDFFGRPEKIESPDGEYGTVTTAFTYSGLETTTTDPDLARKKIVKDYLGRTIQVVEYSDKGEIYTGYTYNAVGDLKTITNHGGIVTEFDYDTLGRKRSMHDPDMGFWEYEYDPNRNLKTQIDHKLQNIKFDYDELNRVTSKTYSTLDPSVVYNYDNLVIPNGIGRLYSASNSQVTVTYDEYDEMGRQVSVSKKIVGNETVFTTINEYDLAGNPVGMTYPDQYKVNYMLYPGTRLLHQVTGSDDVVFAELEDYEPTGKIGYLYQGNGTATTFSYDSKSTRLLDIHTQDPSVEPANDITHKSYKYTRAGDIKEITDHLKNVTRYYGYDKLHRLISETSSGAALVHPSRVIKLTYNYEGDGPFHAPKAIEANGTVHDPFYDQNGNMTISPNLADPEDVPYREISYNADNMPFEINLPAEDSTSADCDDSSQPGAECTQKIEFVYDGDNQRARKTSSKGSTYYISEHFEIINGVATKYIFAGNLRIAKITSSDTQYFHKDHLQSSTAVTNDLGDEVESTDFFPFGHERSSSKLRISYYRYTDQELDPETELYNYDARLYDPVIALFNTPDPYLSSNLARNIFDNKINKERDNNNSVDKEKNIHRENDKTIGREDLISYVTENPQRLNRYAYVLNNPINYIDPFGLARWKGYLTVTAGGEIFGGGVIIGAFESEAHNGKKSTVVVVGVMGGVTAGLPVSTTTGEVTLKTEGAPNPKDFFGAISFVSANAGLVKTGGASYIEIGQAKSEGTFSFQYGFDASTSAYVGWAVPVANQTYDVPAKKNKNK
jgi:RHS repeat-associated protein